MKSEYIECYSNRKYVRSVHIIIGALYKIDQINPAAKKLRGEKVVLVSLPSDTGTVKCLRVESKWHVKRKSYSEFYPCDLVLLPEHADWKEIGTEEPEYDDIQL